MALSSASSEGFSEEFFASALRSKLYESVEALQTDLDTCLTHKCLTHNNTGRPHQGYRNHGHRSIETIEPYLVSVKEVF